MHTANYRIIHTIENITEMYKINAVIAGHNCIISWNFCNIVQPI